MTLHTAPAGSNTLTRLASAECCNLLCELRGLPACAPPAKPFLQIVSTEAGNMATACRLGQHSGVCGSGVHPCARAGMPDRS